MILRERILRATQRKERSFDMRIFLLLLCLTLPAFSATLNVPATYSTVQAAVNAATAGDTVLVASGAYVENILTKASGTSGSPITIDGQGVASIRRFEFDGHDYVHLKNMTVSNYTTAFDASVFFDRGANFNMVSNCIVDNALIADVVGIDFETPVSYPFGATDPVGNLICSNEVKNVRGATMVQLFGSFNIALGNRIHSGGSVDFFRLFGQTNTIFGNLCTNSYEYPGEGNHPDFIQCFGNNGEGSRYHLISSNMILGSVGQFCQLEGNLIPEISNWTFEHNVVREQGLGGSCSIPNAIFRNNTVYLANTNTGGNWIDPGMRFYSRGSVSSSSPLYTAINTAVSSGSIQSASNYVVEGATGLDYITYNGQTRSNGQTFFGVTGVSTYTTTGSPTVYPRFENVATGIVIKNNAIANTGTGASNRGWYSVENPSVNNSNRLIAGILTDFNYVGIGASYGTADAGTVTNGYPTSPWWNTGKFYEHNGINGGDAKFVDVTNPLGADGLMWTSDDGFQIQSGSVLEGAGPGGVNIGAYSTGTGSPSGGGGGGVGSSVSAIITPGGPKKR